MVARQESSALLGCRKKVFENARQMWFLVSAVAMVDVVTMMHLGQQLVDALPRISLLVMEGKELSSCRPMEDLQDFLAVGESSATGRSCESGQDFMEGELACSGRMGTAQQLLQGKMKARGLTGELKSIKR